MVQIGDWKFEAAANELVKGDNHIKLEPQCALVLQYLCEHAGKVVSRDELLDAVWGREAVSTQSIPVVISKLRALFGDSRQQPAYIETVTKRGYRLIASVINIEESNRPNGWRLPAMFNAKRISLLLAAVSSLGVVFAAGFLTSPDVSPHLLYVADVANLTNDSNLNAAAAGASEILSTELARAEGLTVARLRRNPTDNRWVDPELRDSEFSSVPLLTASIIDTEKGKSIIMQLVDGEARQVVWTHSFAIESNDFAADQRQAANELFEHLGLPGNDNDQSPYLGLPGAEEIYWRANFFWGLRGRENNIRAAGLAQQALEIDPNYVPAHALIAQIYAKYSGEYLDIAPLDTKKLSKQHFEFAVSTAPLNPATLTAQTRMLMIFDRRPDLALEAADKAIALGLNNGMIHAQRATSLYLLGRIDEALASIDDAMNVEYGSPYIKVQYIFTNYLGGRYQKVIDVAEEMNPEYYDDFRAQVAASYYEIGDHTLAMKAWFGALNSAGVSVSIEDELLSLVAEGKTRTAYQILSEHVDAAANPKNLRIQELQLYWSFYHGDESLPITILKSIPVTRHARFLLWLHRWPLFNRYKEEPEFQKYLENIGIAKLSNCVHAACGTS